MSNRLGELIRFLKYLPNSYRSHVLELQRRFHGVEDDQRTLYFARNRFLYSPNDVTTFRTWRQFFSESSSAAEVAQFLRLREDCKRFLDIGAAQGLFSAMFCRTAVGPARVVAVEPTDSYISVLRETLSLNTNPSMEYSVQRTALLDQNHATQLDDDALDGFFSKLPERVDPHQEIEVATLDMLCNKLGFEPDLIKIDVDGFEFEILLGSPDFFRRCRTKIHLELHFRELQRRGKDAERILDHLFNTHMITASVPKHFRRASVARLSLEPK